MNHRRAANDEPFFWIKGGAEKKQESIHSIHDIDKEEKTKKTAFKKRSGALNAARAGLKEGWIRATFIVREENLKNLKSLAYWDRKGIKEVLDEALGAYLRDRKIKPVNKEK